MAQDYSVVAEQVTTTGPSGVTVGSGGTLAIASGPANVSGTLTVNAPATISGNIVASGQIAGGGPASATVSVATANNTTIPIATRLVRVSASAATTSGSCTLAAGTLDGMEITLVNESANNIIISGNMKGSAAQTVAANAGARFTWITADTAWFHNT
jgi:hypothetical protein